MSSACAHGKEFGAGAHFAKLAQQTARHHFGWGLYAPHFHTKMRRFNDHANAMGLKIFHQSIRDLLSESLLNLESSGKAVNEAPDF